MATDVASSVMDVATTATKKALGAAGSLVSAAMNAVTPSSPMAQQGLGDDGAAT